MNKKEEYIKTLLLENISTAEQTIKELYEEILEINELPNDCKGIYIDNILCENSNYKIDLLINHYHVIGYMEALKEHSKEMLNFNTMTDQEFESYLIKSEKIQKENKKEMEKIKNILNKK